MAVTLISMLFPIETPFLFYTLFQLRFLSIRHLYTVVSHFIVYTLHPTETSSYVPFHCLHVTSHWDIVLWDLTLQWNSWICCTFANIRVTNDNRYVPLVINTSWSFPHSWLITESVIRLTRRVSLLTSGAGTAYPSGTLEFIPGF
jgi:hypothetical protein